MTRGDGVQVATQCRPRRRVTEQDEDRDHVDPRRPVHPRVRERRLKHDRAHDCPPVDVRRVTASTTSSTVRPAAAASASTRVTNARSRRSCSRGGCACAGRRRDKRADAAARFDHAAALELGVDAGHRIGVDPQLDGELPHGRKLVARPQPARRNRRAQAAFELRVDRRGVASVDGDDAHSDCSIVLVH